MLLHLSDSLIQVRLPTIRPLDAHWVRFLRRALDVNVRLVEVCRKLQKVDGGSVFRRQ
jgi:hypothetical protein